MEELLRPIQGVELIHKRVHSRSALRKSWDLARRDTRIRVIHIVSHGQYSPKRPVIIFAGAEKINLAAEGRSLFKGLRGTVILFSCCEVGDNAELMRILLKASGTKAIFSYTDTVTERQALITEARFYHLAHRHFSGRESTLALRKVTSSYVLFSTSLDLVRKQRRSGASYAPRGGKHA